MCERAVGRILLYNFQREREGGGLVLLFNKIPGGPGPPQMSHRFPPLFYTLVRVLHNAMSRYIVHDTRSYNRFMRYNGACVPYIIIRARISGSGDGFFCGRAVTNLSCYFWRSKYITYYYNIVASTSRTHNVMTIPYTRRTREGGGVINNYYIILCYCRCDTVAMGLPSSSCSAADKEETIITCPCSNT